MTSDAKTLLDSLTQQERQELFGELAQMFVGAIPIRDEQFSWCLPIASSEDIAPGALKTMVACPHIDFTPKKLVICETVTEHRMRDEIAVFDQKNKLKEIYVVEQRELVTLPRNAWRIESILVGANLQFPMSGGIDGELFSPDGNLCFIDKCAAAINIAVCARNLTQTPAVFRSVILGNADQATLRAAV